MKHVFLARLFASAAALLVLAVTVIGGLYFPDYDHLRDYISELGALGTPTGTWVSYGGFLPIGLLVFAFVFTAAPLLQLSGRAKLGFYLLLGVGIGYAGAAIAPCDLGCVGESTRQLIHNSLGLFEYLGGGAGLVLFANHYQKISADALSRNLLRTAGIVTLLGMILLAVPPNPDHAGLNQRIAETALFASLLWIAWRVLRVP